MSHDQPPPGYYPAGDPTVAFAPATGMPPPVKRLRITLFVWTGFSALLLVGAVLMGSSAEMLGRTTWYALPGILALVIGLQLQRPKVWMYRTAIGIGAIGILQALGSMGRGDPRGVTQLILPVLVLVFVLQAPSKAWFRRPVA